MDYQYRLIEPNDDYKQARIEKQGITAEFTIAEVEAMQARNNKSKLEAEGQIKIEEAKMANVEYFHPEVKEMSGETVAAAAVYFDAKVTLAKAQEALKSVDAAIAENATMLDQVKTQFGFTDSVISPIQLNEQDQQNSEG